MHKFRRSILLPQIFGAIHLCCQQPAHPCFKEFAHESVKYRFISYPHNNLILEGGLLKFDRIFREGY